ncbi:hypothetical protein CPC08DRAFT_771666 [Agrocybe pediades]|nr:hypothetical protein CPC08DRAFT_771666 [Agrocybe pediades]
MAAFYPSLRLPSPPPHLARFVVDHSISSSSPVDGQHGVTAVESAVSWHLPRLRLCIRLSCRLPVALFALRIVVGRGAAKAVAVAGGGGYRLRLALGAGGVGTVVVVIATAAAAVMLVLVVVGVDEGRW